MQRTDEPSRPGLHMTPARRDRIQADITDTLGSTSEFITSTADYTRRDRLWPAESSVFDTNPLSVAHGACGPALFLNSPDTPAELPPRALQWMLDRPLSTDDYPPGLYMGLAGIACTLFELGAGDRGVEAMRLACSSSLLFDEPGMLWGAAGWGHAALEIHLRTEEFTWLDWAVRAGDHLVQTARNEGDSCHWIRNVDNPIHFGFGHGASGIALFLMELFTITGIASYRDCAGRALLFDLDAGVEQELGRSWPRYEGDSMLVPYFVHGNAGIGSVLVRCYQATNNTDYLAAARQIAEDSAIKFSATAGLFEGLAGIGEFMLDMHRCTGDVAYRDQALDIAESIMWFRIERPNGAAWPGRWLDTLSNDYAAGAAGIGLFLARLIGTSDRVFLDSAIAAGADPVRADA